MIADAIFGHARESAGKTGVQRHFSQWCGDAVQVGRGQSAQAAAMRKGEQYDSLRPLPLQRAVDGGGHGAGVGGAGVGHDIAESSGEKKRAGAAEGSFEALLQQALQLLGALRVPGAGEGRLVCGGHRSAAV
jgi:hypothetical protein